jgi:propionyl-CoA synthetase
VPFALIVVSAAGGPEGGDAASHADEVAREVVALVRREVGAVASFRHASVVQRLPKTRSGKTLRGIIQKMADGEPYTLPGTIEDEGVIDEIAPIIAAGKPQ